MKNTTNLGLPINTNDSIPNNTNSNGSLIAGSEYNLATTIYKGISGIANWLNGSQTNDSSFLADEQTHPLDKESKAILSELKQIETKQSNVVQEEYLKLIKETKNLSNNIKLRNNKLSKYTDITQNILGKDVDDLTYGQQVMFGILASTTNIEQLVKENEDVAVFISQYLNIKNIKDIALKNYSLTSILTSCIIGGAIGGTIGFTASKAVSYIKKPYHAISNTDVELQPTDSEAVGATGHSALGFTSTGGIVGCISGAISEGLHQLSQDAIVNMQDIINKMILENNINNTEAQNIEKIANTCLGAINDSVNTIMLDMKFPVNYKPMIYDIFYKECNLYYDDEKHAQDNILERLNLLKTKEIMALNSMPTANTKLLESAYYAFISEGEIGILKLKEAEDLSHLEVQPEEDDKVSYEAEEIDSIQENEEKVLLSRGERSTNDVSQIYYEEIKNLKEWFSYDPIAKEHIDNLEDYIRNANNLKFNKKYADSFNYYNLSLADEETPELSKMVENLGVALKIYEDVAPFLSEEQYIQNKISDFSNKLADYYIDQYKQNTGRTKRDTETVLTNPLSENREELSVDDIMNIIGDIRNQRTRSPRSILQNSKNSKLPSHIRPDLATYFKKDVGGEVVETATEKLAYAIKGLKKNFCSISGARKKPDITVTKNILKKRIKNMTPKTVTKGAFSFGRQIAAGLAVEAMVGVAVRAHQENQMAKVKEEFNNFINYLTKSVYQDLESYAQSNGYTSVKSMFIEVSKKELEEEREALYKELLDVIKQSYGKHIAKQIVSDILKEGNAHETKVFLSFLQASLSFISIVGGPIGLITGVAGSIPASSFFNPELTVTNNCFEGSEIEQRFGYLNSITFIGGFFEAANDAMNAENFVHHRYNQKDSPCEIGMKDAKDKVLQSFDSTNYIGLHNQYTRSNLYTLDQYRNHDNKTLASVAASNYIANKNVRENYDVQYFTSAEEEKIENNKSKEFVKYINESTDYQRIEKEIEKKEDKMRQLKDNILIARYVNQNFNNFVRREYPELYYDIVPSESIFCVENTGPRSEPDCLNYGERKLENMCLQAYDQIGGLSLLNNDLTNLYKQKSDILTTLSSKFEETSVYKKYKEDLENAKKKNNNSKYFEFNNKVTKWKQSMGDNIKEGNIDTFTKVEYNCIQLYTDFKDLTEEVQKLDATLDQKQQMNEVLSSQFASYMQILLIASRKLNDDAKKANSHHKYFSPILNFLKKEKLINIEAKDGFNDFTQSSNAEGVGINDQMFNHNKQFIQGVIENSGFFYPIAETASSGFVLNPACKQNYPLIQVLNKMGYTTYRAERQIGEIGETSVSIVNDRSCQVAQHILDTTKLQELYQYNRLSDEQVDDILITRFSSLAIANQYINLAFWQKVKNHAALSAGEFIYERSSEIRGEIDPITKDTKFSNALKSKTNVVDPKSPESLIIEKYINSQEKTLPTLIDEKKLNKYSDFFVSYFTIIQIIDYDRKKQTGIAQLNNDTALKKQIDDFNKAFSFVIDKPVQNGFCVAGLTEGKISTNIPSITQYEDYLLSYYGILSFGLKVIKELNSNSYLHVSGASYVTSMLNIQNINSGCGLLDENNNKAPYILQPTLSSIEPHMREMGMPVFNIDGTMNANAVLSLIGTISQDGIKNMPALKSYDGSIVIPKGLFSPEKIRDYYNQLMPEVKSPNDYKALVINQCANAIAGGNLKKSKECILVLEEMQRQAVPNNYNLFNQIGDFIKESQKIIKTYDASYKIRKEIIFDIEYANYLINAPLETDLSNRLSHIKKLLQVHNNLLNLKVEQNETIGSDVLEVIHNKIKHLASTDEKTKITLLIALGYIGIAEYKKDANTFENINYDAIKNIEESCPYFYNYNNIKPDYTTAINVYNNIGYYTKEVSIEGYVKDLNKSILKNYYQNKLKETDPIMRELGDAKTIPALFAELETAFRKSVASPETLMELQRMISYLYNYCYINDKNDLIKEVNEKLVQNNLFTDGEINYLSVAQAILPASNIDLIKLNDVYPEALEQIVKNNQNYNIYKAWVNAQDVPKDVKSLALKVVEEKTASKPNLTLDLNIYNEAQIGDIENYQQFKESLSGNVLGITLKRYEHILKRALKKGRPLSKFNASTLAILMRERLITYRDIKNADEGDSIKSNNAIKKIYTLIKTYQNYYAQLDESVKQSVKPYTGFNTTEQKEIDQAFISSIPKGNPIATKVDITLEDSFATIEDSKRVINPISKSYKIKVDQENSISGLKDLLEISDKHEAALQDFQTRFYHPNSNANVLHEQFAEFSNKLEGILNKFKDLELVSLNYESIGILKENVFNIIESFNNAYDIITIKNAHEVGLHNPLTNKIYNKNILAVDSINNPYFEYNLNLLQGIQKISKRSLSDVEVIDENNNIEMEINTGVNVNLADVASKNPDTMIWIKLESGQETLIPVNKNNLASLKDTVERLPNVMEINVQTPEAVFKNDMISRKALLPSVVESILHAKDSKVADVPIHHQYYDKKGNTRYVKHKFMRSEYYSNILFNKNYVSRAREDIESNLSALLEKHRMTKEQFKTLISSPSLIDLEDINPKYASFLKDLILAANRNKNFLLTKLKYSPDVQIYEDFNHPVTIDLALGEFEARIPKYENIYFYDSWTKLALRDMICDLDSRVTPDSFVENNEIPDIVDFTALKYFHLAGIQNLQSMYDNINNPKLHTTHAALFLELLNARIISKRQTSPKSAKMIINDFFVKHGKVVTPQQIDDIIQTIKYRIFRRVKDDMSFAAITSSILVSIAGKGSAVDIDKTILAIESFDFPLLANMHDNDITNNVNWLLSPKVVEAAKSLSTDFNLAMSMRKMADEMEIALLLGEKDVSNKISYMMSNINNNLEPARFSMPISRGQKNLVNNQFLPKSVLPVSNNIPDSNMPNIRNSILISAFRGHSAAFEGIKYITQSNDLTELPIVYYDGVTVVTHQDIVKNNMNSAISKILANQNNDQISFFIETHGSRGTNILNDDTSNYNTMMNLTPGSDVNNPANFIYLLNQVVKQRIANKNNGVAQPRLLNVRFNLHACYGAQPSPDFISQTGLSEASQITTINNSATSNMKLSVDSYIAGNSELLKEAGIKDISLIGFYGEVYVNSVGINSQTLSTNAGSYLKLSRSVNLGNIQQDEWQASQHNIRQDKRKQPDPTKELKSMRVC